MAVEIQPLEPRTLLAGIVTAALTGSGANARLTITGDSADNQVSLRVDSNGIVLKAEDDSTVIKFNRTRSEPGGEVQISETPISLQDLIVKLNRGDDQFG